MRFNFCCSPINVDILYISGYVSDTFFWAFLSCILNFLSISIYSQSLFQVKIGHCFRSGTKKLWAHLTCLKLAECPKATVNICSVFRVRRCHIHDGWRFVSIETLFETLFFNDNKSAICFFFDAAVTEPAKWLFGCSRCTGRIQCEVLTTLPILSSWIKKFLGQQSKIWVDNSVEKLFR